MAVETTDTLVVGGGQAGIAMSAHLRRAGVPHLVLERARIAERWRSERWDSLVANGPAWHDRFPGLDYTGTHPDAFPGKERVADYFVEYARMIEAPIRCGVEVTSVEKLAGRPGFRAETSEGVIEAKNVVVATGPFQHPAIPALVPKRPGLLQIHSTGYRNPDALPDGGVLVVGAGSSGAQIAEELLRAGRDITLSIGPHGRPARRYRGRDLVWWLGVLGKWEIPTPAPDTEHVTISISGAEGGHTIDFRDFAARGMILVGRAESHQDGVLHFRPDLARNIAGGDADYLSLLDEADAYAERQGLDLPEDPEARQIGPDPDCLRDPILSLDLARAGITTIIWATGFALDYGWLHLDVFDTEGKPLHQRGVSTEPGLYFLGLPWLSRRGSSFIWGVWHDASHIADQITIQRNYQAYQAPAASKTDRKHSARR